MSSMKSKGQTRKEVFDPTESLPSPRHQIRIGTWNTQTMYQAGKTAQVIREMQNYNLNLLGVSEVRWTGAGKMTFSSGETFYYSGRDDDKHAEGVGFILDRKAKKTLMEWEPINSRLIRARFFSKTAKLTIIQCYAPTEDADTEIKDEFYSKLQEQLAKVHKRDILLVMGDLNAKVGSDNTGFERNMGKHGLGSRNDNGGRLLELCCENELIIGGTLFQHKTIHKETWISPDGKTKNQIDHFIINKRWKTAIKDVKSIRGAEIGSDHQLLLCKLKLKLKKVKKVSQERIFNSEKLNDPETRQDFALKLSNKFQILSQIPTEDLDEYCGKVHDTFLQTSKDTIGYKEYHRKAWLSDRTWNLIQERKTLRQKILSSSTDEKNSLQRSHREKSRQIKNSARTDKKQFLDRKAQDAEDAARSNDTHKLYKITKELTKPISSSCSVIRDRNGNLLVTEEEQISRWAEHFNMILNRPSNEVPAFTHTPRAEIEMNRRAITCREIEEAILETKCNRAPGDDKITSDMLKVDPGLSAKCLVELFNKVWLEEKVPDAWKKGIIIKLPKKGDLKECGNWRGINLLSVPGKIFCRILLHRMKTSLDKILREEQAGFRPSRSCTDQIFVLRTIIEQSVEWNSSLYLNFIDFEKAFDSVQHPALWKLLELYGLPNKAINIIRNMYADNRCCVRHEGKQSEWFQVKSGVRQGCVISPLLFLIVIDWIMKTATSDKPRGISWNLFERLEDEDFADDIALISHTYKDMQEKTTRVEQIAKTVGLKINHTKTKIMRINTKVDASIKVNGENLDNVSDFKYLGSVLAADGSIEKEIKTRIALASAAFQRLSPVWKSKIYKTKTKLKLYLSNVRSVLLYAAETWRTNKQIESRLRGFEGRCLRRILRIRWEQKVTNQEITARTGIGNIVEEVKRRRWRWLGHVLRMGKKRHPHIALTWTPQGQRKKGRPRGTWRRTIDSERMEAGLTWNEILKWNAQDREGWRKFVGATCSQGGDG